MLKVTSLGGVEIGTGGGAIFSKLLNKWSESVGIDIKEQIKVWDSQGIMDKHLPLIASKNQKI